LNTADVKQIPWEDVRGLKIIMPKSMNPEFFAEPGQISRIMREYGLIEVDIGGVGEIHFLSTSTSNRKSAVQLFSKPLLQGWIFGRLSPHNQQSGPGP
jgi:hypothetical protein